MFQSIYSIFLWTMKNWITKNLCSYKHAIDGLIRVSKEEGFKKLFNGVDWATGRAVIKNENMINNYIFAFCCFAGVDDNWTVVFLWSNQGIIIGNSIFLRQPCDTFHLKSLCCKFCSYFVLKCSLVTYCDPKPRV